MRRVAIGLAHPCWPAAPLTHCTAAGPLACLLPRLVAAPSLPPLVPGCSLLASRAATQPPPCGPSAPAWSNLPQFNLTELVQRAKVVVVEGRAWRLSAAASEWLTGGDVAGGTGAAVLLLLLPLPS